MSEGTFYRPPAAGAYDTSAGGLGTSPTWLSPMEGGKGEPAGVIHMYAGVSAPGGYLICDGSAVDRKTYKRLFTLFGTAFGAGDNSTTFNLPDLRGRIPVGTGPNPDVSLVGMSEGLGPTARSPKHNHVLPDHGHFITDPGHVHSMWMARFGGSDSANFAFAAGTSAGVFGFPAPSVDINIQENVANSTTGISVGNPTSHPIVGPVGRPADAPAYLAINYIIKT